MKRSRISSDAHWRHTHDQVLHWFNGLMMDLKQYVYADHVPLIPPSSLSSWPRYRVSLNCKDWGRVNMSGEVFDLHSEEIRALDSLVADLTAIWEKRKPENPVDERRLDYIGSLYPKISKCREDMVKY